jgi:transcriptional regulator with XRE-family HTH domain
MAGDLEISPSYVNLIERNQRPVSADILIRLSTVYGLDLSHLAAADSDALFSELASAFADPIFKNAGASREDALDLAAGNPVLGEAVAQLYRAWRTAQTELVEARAAGRGAAEADPVVEARAFLQANRNHFPLIDAAAEGIAGELSAGGSLLDALAGRFAARHGLRVRFLPDDVMTGAYRRLNRHAGELAARQRQPRFSPRAAIVADRTARAARSDRQRGALYFGRRAASVARGARELRGGGDHAAL